MTHLVQATGSLQKTPTYRRTIRQKPKLCITFSQERRRQPQILTFRGFQPLYPFLILFSIIPSFLGIEIYPNQPNASSAAVSMFFSFKVGDREHSAVWQADVLDADKFPSFLAQSVQVALNVFHDWFPIRLVMI